MNQKERIMQLVQQGVITTEDALILLENDQQSSQHTSEAQMTNLEKMQEVEQHLTAAHSEMDMLESLELIAPLNQQQKQRVQELENEIQSLKEQRDTIEHDEMEKEQKEEEQHDNASSINNATSEFVQQMGSLLKKTGNHVQNYLKEAVERQKELRTPKPFKKTYEFTPQVFSQISILLHNGNVDIKLWDNDYVKINIDANLYTLEDDLEALFLNNSQLQVNADELLVQIVDKNIAADMVVYLPQHDYHHLSIRTETGNVNVTGLQFEDGYVKTTHGSLSFNQLHGVMLESYTTNGHIQITHSHIRELVADAVNGKITADGEFMTTQTVTTNGDISVLNTSRDIEEMTQETLNGNIDITVKEGLPFAISANTKYGTIQHHLSHLEVILDETTRAGQVLNANVRYNSSLVPAFILKARSKTGMITLKQYGGEA